MHCGGGLKSLDLHRPDAGMRFALLHRMALSDTLRSLTNQPSRPLKWACASRSQVFDAAFELHEVAVHAGFAPDEATTLSLTLAELSTPVAEPGSECSVSLHPRGWHLEVTARHANESPRIGSAQVRGSLRTELRDDGSVKYVADYERPPAPFRASTLQAAVSERLGPASW